MGKVVVIGTFDTKGEELGFVSDIIKSKGLSTLLIDVGTRSQPAVKPDITAQELAEKANISLEDALARGDRGECVSLMCDVLDRAIPMIHEEEDICGIISLGGGGGTALGTAAMRSLPIGIPKLMVSTLASGDTSAYVDIKDIVMMPSIVDVAGLNPISQKVFNQAAYAMVGMVQANEALTISEARPLIAASMFGNTTDCLDMCRDQLVDKGYDCLIFHATGTGGRSMDATIESGLIKGVLDLTTTELADEVVGGVLSAGEHRMEAAAKAGIPTVIAPGCLDMVNFGGRETLPAGFEDRNIYIHNPQVTLVRTTAEECKVLGQLLAEKANAHQGPVVILLPTKGISMISLEGQPFYDAEADQALFDAIKAHADCEVVEIDVTINDPVFADRAVVELLGMLSGIE